ncbi:MAG: putative primase/helicase [Chloroflexota bacterium]|nr:putative primase/helicase [Chloroflexota bacterium]
MTHHPDDSTSEVVESIVTASTGRRRSLAACRLDVPSLLDEPETPVPWRCDKLAADGYVTVLTGEGGEGKSFLALALAKAVAEGGSAAGIACLAGRAVIFDAENGERLLARRLKAARVPRKGVEVYNADGFDIRRDIEDFKAVIRAERADLVVLDSLRILAPGAKESEGDDMAPVMTAIRHVARETGAAVVVVHHRGKGENASDYRGSSVIRDQADMLFVLGRNKSDPQARTRRSVKTSKCRIDFEPDTRWLSVETDDETGAVSIEGADPFDGGPGEGRTSKRHLLADELRPHLTTQPRTRADLARAVSRRENDSQVGRALDLLAEQGLAVRTSAGGWVVVSQPANPQGHGWMAEDDDAHRPELREAA